MSVMTSFTLRSLKKNRMRTVVSIIGIALSCALLTAVFTSVTSLHAGLLHRTLTYEGSWQIFSPGFEDEEIDALAQSGNVVDMAVSHELGSAYLTESDSMTLGKIATVRTLPQAVKGVLEPGGVPLTLLPEIREGRMPASQDEVILPDFCKGVTFGSGEADAGVSSDVPLEVGGSIRLDLGMRMVDDEDGKGLKILSSAVYDYRSPDAGPYPNEEELVGARPRAYTVVGFYDRQSSFMAGNTFTAASSATSIVAITAEDAQAEGIASTYLTIQDLPSMAAITGFMESITNTEDTFVAYHQNLYPYQGIDDGRPITGTLWAIALVLAVVIVVASVSLIYNSFAISVADRTRQFGLLSSIGASRKQLRRSVLFEAAFLGLIGIPVGVLVGIAGVSAVFALTQDAFMAMMGTGNAVTVHVEVMPLAVVVLISAMTLLASAWIPARRAGRVSAVDAIRQTQDVRMSRRVARKAARAEKKVATHGTGAIDTSMGLSGKLFGTPGFLAHRSLSRSSARGRTVVASLAVSVMLIVVAGSVATYLTPISDRAESKDGAGSGADIVVSGTAPDSNDLSAFSSKLADFTAKAEALEGVELISSFRQGQVYGVLPADMLSSQGRMAGDDLDRKQGSLWTDSSFSANGAFTGIVIVFYIDSASWSDLVSDLGLDPARFSDPASPRAIALNRYQSISADNEYIDAKPFSQTGTIDAYLIDKRAQWDSGTWTFVGLQENDEGHIVAKYADVSSEKSTGTIDKPIDEVASHAAIEVGGLVEKMPPSINAASSSSYFPVIILPDSAAGSSAGAASPDGVDGQYDYHGTSLSFKAEDHKQAAEDIEALTKELGFSGFHVNDITDAARQNRMVSQAVQLFIFCFALIMMLIAVANVFNTLTNSIILRTREFAMLKSAGMGDRAFTRMLIYECASYAWRGLAIGLVIAVGATFLLYQATRMSFVGIGFDLPWPFVGLAVIVVLIVLASSVVFALKKSNASSVVDALRTDVA